MSEKSPLQSDRGVTIVETPVVSQVVGIAAQEVEGVQMGGAGSRAAGSLLEGITGGGGGGQTTRGVVVEVGDEEAAIDLDMSVEYGKSIPQLSEAVRRNIVNRVENLVGLEVAVVNITVNDVLFPDQQSSRGTGQQEQNS